MYAILDIETTGGKFNEEGITEIAIYRYDGHNVVDQFMSLINPEKPIQEFVEKLTGINSKMLRNAPKFHEVAKRIIEITRDCILVAHNAAFDSRILVTEFKHLGYDFHINTLCTVELSRELIPNEKSYSLGKLCRSLGIPMTNRHRASGDALATVQLFKLLLSKDHNKSIIRQTIKFSNRKNVKSKLNKILDSIPEKMGVFYMHEDCGNVIYVGRAQNIKFKVSKLFLKDSKRARKIHERVQCISYELSGNELFNRLIHRIELEILKPKFNFIKRSVMQPEDFAHHNFVLEHCGRNIEEKAIILVENNEVIGYGFTNLSFQKSKLDVLKSVLTPIENKLLAKNIVKNYLKNHSVLKVIRF
ncbi:MAG: DNA polymerase III subunit epsilon [Flavobacteriales bacterium]|nr:DNA polymerase III subunit epsilon [Flavobacteriales bacterium]